MGLVVRGKVKVCVTALYLWAEIACWMYTGERQVGTLRKRYLEAVLMQDVGFFDTDARTGDIVFGVSTDTLLVQDAISEKVSLFFLFVISGNGVSGSKVGGFVGGELHTLLVDVPGWAGGWVRVGVAAGVAQCGGHPRHCVRRRALCVYYHWSHFEES